MHIYKKRRKGEDIMERLHKTLKIWELVRILCMCKALGLIPNIGGKPQTLLQKKEKHKINK